MSKCTVFSSQPTVSTMTITSRLKDAEKYRPFLTDSVKHIPTKVVDEENSASAASIPDNVDINSPGVKKKCGRKKKCSTTELDTGVVWDNISVVVSICLTPHVGRRGCGEAVRSNFRNCIPFRAGNRGAKVFVSGTIQAWGFKSLDEFHSFMDCVLKKFKPDGAEVDRQFTKVALAISDAALDIKGGKIIALRPLAKKCNDAAVDGETVEYSPDTFPGIKIKLPHPSVESKLVSVTVRMRGNVKLYIGTPPAGDSDAIPRLWNRVSAMLG